ncbi:dehydrogenase/reductase SDR family member 8 [Cordyceps javanica]|uniref:Short-chain dehydrogenase/reductase 3 n=1 Tax=Cordyceps javanica TaxID=43265 RepID=A0A545VMM5_9HYPO|nr:dehydrogenase/reductase SDR family member 8 [Cordyceps javanica]TQW02951.1 dehydrogenase/reductase SDR family member 8 [Cordyceps javanica]
MTLIHYLESPPVHALGALVRFLTSPLVTGAALLAFTQSPPDLQAEVVRRLAFLGDGVAKPETVALALKVAFGWGLVKGVNAALNSAASNAWRFTKARGWDWPNEVAVVTGGCSGIGLNVVEQLTARGVRCAVLDVQPLPKGLEGHRHVRYFKCDVTDPDSVRSVADAVRAEYGHPSILVNNAGITVPKGILEIPPATLNKVFAVNTISHWYLVQAFVPHMVEVNKGHVVTVASMASFVALAKGADYSATKAAALAFHESLNSELRNTHGATGVLTTVVHPNFVATPLVAKFSHELEKGGIRLLTSDDVARQLTDQVFACKGAQIVCPERLSFITGFRSLPAWIQFPVRNMIAGNSKNI